jgi:hypothetical protein
MTKRKILAAGNQAWPLAQSNKKKNVCKCKLRWSCSNQWKTSSLLLIWTWSSLLSFLFRRGDMKSWAPRVLPSCCTPVWSVDCATVQVKAGGATSPVDYSPTCRERLGEPSSRLATRRVPVNEGNLARQRSLQNKSSFSQPWRATWWRR